MIRIPLLCAIAALAGGCVTVHVNESRVFQPGPCSAAAIAPAASAEFAIEPFIVRAGDDVALSVIALRHARPRGTILYFGGNGSRYCADQLRDTSSGRLLHNLGRLGYNVVLVNYRGYGDSGGRPTFELIKRDALAIYDYVAARDFAPPLVVYGQSLGGLFAATVAMHRPVSALVVESPPTTYREVIGSATPWYAKPFVRVRMTRAVESENLLNVVDKVNERLLVMVGSRDPLTPPKMASRVLKAAASQDKSVVIIRGGGHGDLVEFDEYWAGLQSFLTGGQ